MIIAHEWEGEPHNSPSVKKLYRPDEPLIEYAWEDREYRSQSVKYIDKKEVARNLLYNSDFTMGFEGWVVGSNLQSYWDTEDKLTGDASARVSEVYDHSTGMYYAPRSLSGLNIGDFLAAKVWVKATPGKVLHFMQNNLGINSNSKSTIFTSSGEWEEVLVSGAKVAGSLSPYVLVRLHESSETPVDIWVDRVIMAVGETEEEALRQLHEGYFDGNTRHEHGIVLSRNLARNPKGSNTPNTVVVVPNYEGSISPDPDFDLVDGNLVAPNPRYHTGYNCIVYYSRTRGALAIRPIENNEPFRNMYVISQPHEVQSDTPVGIGLEVWTETNVESFVLRFYIIGSTPSSDYITVEGGRAYLRNYGVGDGTWVSINIDNARAPISAGDTYYFRVLRVQGPTEESVERQLDHTFNGDTPDYQIPNTKVYFDGEWVSLYDYHA